VSAITNLVTTTWSWTLASALIACVVVAAAVAVFVDWGPFSSQPAPDVDAKAVPPSNPIRHPPAAPTERLNTLPGDLGEFTGRRAEVGVLLARREKEAAAIGIHAVDGMAGVGKTTLAVHVAHLLAERYPDAQLYVNLRGYLGDQEPMRPEEALEVL